MTSHGATAVTPTLSATDLVAAVPALADAATLQTHTLAVLPGASLSHADVLVRWRGRAALSTTAPTVWSWSRGQDTLEETAYLLDLFWDRPQALVVTGAMRSPQQPGSDGPANLLAAVLTAAQRDSDGLGVLGVLNDEIHAAVRVAKSHSMAVDAFHSPVFGPLGRLVEGRAVFGNRPGRQPHLPMPASPAADPRVALLTSHLGDPPASCCSWWSTLAMTVSSWPGSGSATSPPPSPSSSERLPSTFRSCWGPGSGQVRPRPAPTASPGPRAT